MEIRDDIDFITIDEMLDHAEEYFLEIRQYIAGPGHHTRRKSLKKKINRVLFKHKLIMQDTSVKKSESNAGDKPDAEGTSGRKRKNEAHKVSRQIAEFVIECIMKDYFVRKTEEFKKLDEKEIKEKSREMDRLLSAEQQELFEIGSSLQSREDVGKDVDMAKELLDSIPAMNAYAEKNEGEYADRMKEKIELRKDMAKKYDKDGIHESCYRYHIPAKSWYKEHEEDVEGLPVEFADQVIDRMMLHALFYTFYDFTEETFRKDLMERSKCISPGEPKEFYDGYSELTGMLENPMGHYVFPKKEKQPQKNKPSGVNIKSKDI